MRITSCRRATALLRRGLLTLLVAATLLAGCVSLSRATPAPSPTLAPTEAICQWSAALIPSRTTIRKLDVVGKCDVATTGHTVELRPKVPQGINPRDLLLEKVVTPPSGATIRMRWTVTVIYERESEVPYDTVTILPDGVTVRVVDPG